MTVRQLRLVVEAADYDRALAFYRDHLGLEQQEAYEGPGGAHVTILGAGRATLELANPQQHAYIDSVEVGRDVAGHVRVAFEVDDSAAVADRLVEAGADLIAPAVRTPWDSLNARLDGPAGLQLTVFTELAGPAGSEPAGSEPAASPGLDPDAGVDPHYPILTERLLLRPIDPVDDIDALHAYYSREDVCAYIPPTPSTREEVAERFARPGRTRAVLTEAGQVLALAVVRRDTGELIGDLVLMWHSAADRAGEIGYVINPDHAGHGYATEAGAALLALAFDGLGLHRVTGRIDEDNPASGAVLRKLGMRQEAVLVENEWFKGRWSTEVGFAILEREWRARRGG